MSDFQPILLDLPLPIMTPRLMIRPVMPGDGQATHDAIEETFDQLHRWMPWAGKQIEPSATEINIREAHARFILRKDFRMNGYERQSERLVVCSGLHDPDWKIGRFEIGYWVRKSAQGQGYAAEIANALARYAFSVLNARRVESRHAEGNQASRATIRKLGFDHEGVRRQGMVLPDGTIADEHLYALLSPDPLPPLDVTWG